MNYVLKLKPSRLIQLNEVSDGEQQGLELQTNYFPLNVLHLFVIKPHEAVQLLRKCVPSYSEEHALLWKVHANAQNYTTLQTLHTTSHHPL
jgi:hypothetical protein